MQINFEASESDEEVLIAIQRFYGLKTRADTLRFCVRQTVRGILGSGPINFRAITADSQKKLDLEGPQKKQGFVG